MVYDYFYGEKIIALTLPIHSSIHASSRQSEHSCSLKNKSTKKTRKGKKKTSRYWRFLWIIIQKVKGIGRHFETAYCRSYSQFVRAIFKIDEDSPLFWYEQPNGIKRLLTELSLNWSRASPENAFGTFDPWKVMARTVKERQLRKENKRVLSWNDIRRWKVQGN